jgi:hypothetical protein
MPSVLPPTAALTQRLGQIGELGYDKNGNRPAVSTKLSGTSSLGALLMKHGSRSAEGFYRSAVLLVIIAGGDDGQTLFSIAVSSKHHLQREADFLVCLRYDRVWRT